MKLSSIQAKQSTILLFLCIICLLLSAGAVCQDPLHIKFENISVRDGLSQNTPNCIFQDSRGLLWIGTEDGLNKYNGYEFEIFRYETGNSNSLSLSKIKCIEEDPDGDLWIGTIGGGLNKYEREKNSFQRFMAGGIISSLIPGSIVTCIKCMQDGKLWIGTDKGLRVLDRQTGSSSVPALRNNKPLSVNGLYIKDLVTDNQGLIWIGTDEGLTSVDTVTSYVTFYSHDPGNPNSLLPGMITCLYSDSKGNIWVGTENGAAVKRSGTDIFVPMKAGTPSSAFEIRDFLEDENGNIWIATFGGGLDIFVPGKELIISNTFDYNSPHTISHNEVSSLCMDRTGILWAGTYGLDKYNPRKEKFKLYDYITNTNKNDNISFKSVYAIYEDDNSVFWIGSKLDGVHVFDRSNNNYFSIRHQENNPNSLSSNKVRVIKENPAGVIWIGTDNGGLNKVLLDENRRPERFIHYNHDPLNPNSLSSDLIYSLYFDEKNKIWIGTDNGLNCLDPESDSITRYVPDSTNPESLSNATAYYIYGDVNEEMWIATDYGINKYNPETNGFIHYVHDEKDTNSVIINEILTFYEDSENRMWVGTFSGGLDLFDRKKNRFIHFNTIRELSDAVIYGIFEDGKSNLWMSTNNGIIQFNPQTRFIKQYTIEDGLQSNEFNGGAYFRNPEGEIFFGGYFGFNSFFPEDIKLDTVAPAIILADLQIKHESVRPGKKSPIKKQIAEVEEIILNHKQNNFTLYFAALHYANPSQNKYRYKLDGFDKEWIDLGHKRFVSFTGLPYRKYRLMIQAANCDGKWNETGISIKIRIKPPLMGTRVAKLILILLFAGLIFFAVRYWMKREEIQKRRLEERVSESTRELEMAREKLEKQKEEIIIQKQELKLREKDQEELLWFNQGIGMFSEFISKNKDDLKMLSEQLIMKLVEYIEGQQGGVFLLNDDDENDIHLEMVAHYAYNIERLNTRFLPGEGYVGTCFAEKRFIEIDDLPEGYSVLRSGLGEKQLRHLLLAPLKLNEVAVGVIEIASFRKIKGYKVVFVEKLCETFASTVSTEKSNTKLKRLIDRTRKQAEELQEGEEELRQNLEEMQATQEESGRREDELIHYAEEAASREELLNKKIEELETKIKNLTEKEKRKKKE